MLINLLKLTLNILAILSITTSCKQNNSSSHEEGKSRPDSEGLPPPDWYLAGARITDVRKMDSGKTIDLKDLDLKYQNCNFLDLGGQKTFMWKFSDYDFQKNPSPSHYNDLDIYLETSKLPEKDSSWNFGSSHPESQYVTLLQERSVTDHDAWTTSISDSKCSLKVVNQAQGPALKAERGSIAQFYIKADLTCDKIYGSKKQFLRFNADVNCDGLLFFDEAPKVNPFTVKDTQSGKEWAFTSFENYETLEKSCTALGQGFHIPTLKDFEGSENFLITSKIGKVLADAPLGSSFMWTSEGEPDRVYVLEYDTDYRSGKPSLHVLFSKDKKKFKGTGVCVK